LFSLEQVSDHVSVRDSREIRYVDQELSNRIVAGISLALLASCSSAQTNVADSTEVGQGMVATQGNAVSNESLPINQRFRNLDEYLAWLRKYAAAVDRPWYKEIRPGVYELQAAGNLHLDVPNNEKRVFTRAELEKKFGFSK
jgi:thermostable 8-oxoguanine DNA glycosylase